MRPSNKTDTADSVLTEFAPAKVNLTLHVVGRRADGYHELESLVAFAATSDRLVFEPDYPLALNVIESAAASCGPDADNLVLKAAHALAARVQGLRLGRFRLDKRLPVAAGLGGGSADAAAALRLLARINDIALDDPRLYDAACAIGADVPMCLDPRPRHVSGIGDVLSEPIALPPVPAVLVNPGVPVPTKDVFARLRIDRLAPRAHAPFKSPRDLVDAAALLAVLADGRNDLEEPAIAIAPVISEVLAALRALPGCGLARMSGSGATCFGLFDAKSAAARAAEALDTAHRGWWVRETSLEDVRPTG